MENNNALSWVGNIFAGVLTAIQTNPVLQTICLVLTCVSIAFSIFYNVYKWWKDAKSDGKITDKELDQLSEIIKDSGEQISEVVDKFNKKEEKGDKNEN